MQVTVGELPVWTDGAFYLVPGEGAPGRPAFTSRSASAGQAATARFACFSRRAGTGFPETIG